MVRGECLTDQMWDHQTNNNHTLSDSSLVDAVILHSSVSYDPILQHVELYGKVYGKGVYRHFVTSNNMSTLHCYQVRKKGEVRNDRKVKTGFFWSKKLYNHFTYAWPGSAVCSDYKRDTKDERITNINIKEVGNDGNGQVDEPDV